VIGRVASFSPASGAEFSLLPPENATGNFTKVVQRIPVRISLPAGHPLAGQLRPGMSVVVRVDTGGGGEAGLGSDQAALP
jgi:membrane fusion protein (multidrug efflux system)